MYVDSSDDLLKESPENDTFHRITKAAHPDGCTYIESPPGSLFKPYPDVVRSLEVGRQLSMEDGTAAERVVTSPLSSPSTIGYVGYPSRLNVRARSTEDGRKCW